MQTIVIAFVLFRTLFLSVRCESVVRQTLNGPVEGIEKTSSLGQQYYAFKGIPYAETPITGKDPYTDEQVDRRFKAPVPLKRIWSESLKVDEYADFCILNSQNGPKFFVDAKTSEDCLFVNVYVPVGGSDRKTVLVWIHGGAFSLGDARETLFGPDFLLSQDNIVVTVQYRLGIFGFLNLDFDEYSGNMGLKDQQLAMKWVYENIENFSGNKNEILLFGESAGGASVGFHLLSEESRKYFNRAFLSSSSAFSHYALARANHLQRMQKSLNTTDNKQLIEILKKADSQILTKLCVTDNPNTLTFPWVPTIESSNASGAFITKPLDEIYNSNEAPVMDVMFSFNSKEIVYFRPELLNEAEPLIKQNWQESNVELPFEGFDRESNPQEYEQSLALLKKVYFPDLTNSSAIKDGNIQLLSDIMFCDSILKSVILQANSNSLDKNKQKNTFLFRFSMDFGLNIFKILTQKQFDGATHAEDLCYYFHCHLLDSYKIYDNHLEQKDATYDAIIRMVKMITNFARTGNPSLGNDTAFQSCKSSSEVYCQEISNSPKSSVTADIKEQLHYDTWRNVEAIYNNRGTKLQTTDKNVFIQRNKTLLIFYHEHFRQLSLN